MIGSLVAPRIAESARAFCLSASSASFALLSGLRYPPHLAARVFKGVRSMAESSTFLATLAEEARKIVLRLGRKRFGPASPDTISALEAIEDPEELEALTERVLDVSRWDELLPKRATRRANGKRRK